MTPIFFVGATSGAALAPFVGVPTTFLSAVGLVAMLAAAANTPIAAAVMAIEISAIDQHTPQCLALTIAVARTQRGHVHHRDAPRRLRTYELFR